MRTASAPLENRPAVYYPVHLGNSIAYLIKGEDGYILVDAGNTASEKKLVSFMRNHEILPRDIRLIVVTHAHYDHIRRLDAVKRLCGCPVAVGMVEGGLLEGGKVVVPPGANLSGRISSTLLKMLKALVKPKLPRVTPDILVSDDVPLSEFGINGWIIPTPGHTEGSISVLLATGEAFVGDLTVNYRWFNRGPVFPPFASDVDELFKSWQKLIDAGATVILPGHGKKFYASRLSDTMYKLQNRYYRASG